MTKDEEIYTGLSVFFTSLLVLGNLTYQKFIVLKTPLYHFELSVGAVLYPLTFLLTDLITELYGKEKATFCIRWGMVMNILVALIISLMDALPATSWSKINDQTFHAVFGYYTIAFIGSLIACYTAQAVDVILYLWIRKITHGKYLWLRSNGSTCISLLIDTTVVIGFMTFFGIFSVAQMVPLILNSYSWKLLFTLCSTPLFYLSVFSLKRLGRS
jgi:uncharacterized integral membrane protein (TIGR00697 family)